jgi:phage recombination protein Bet
VTDLATRPSSSLALNDSQDYWTPQQVATLKQLGVDGASEGDLRVFFHQCRSTGLDPFAKQVYMIGRWSREGTKYTIQTGIDGYRLIARRAVDRTGETLGYDPNMWCGPDGKWREVWLETVPPRAAKVTVYRNGQPFPAIALWDEYVQTVKDKQTGQAVPNSMWGRMGAGQLAKCAEALALRKAFPQDLSGLYTTEEMGQADSERRTPVDTPRPVQAPPAPARDWLADGYACDNLDTLRALWIEARDAGANVPGSELRGQLDKLVEAFKADQQPAEDVQEAEIVEESLSGDGWPAPSPVPS